MEKQCEKIRENIQGYFEKALSKQAYENTEKHLQECPDCSWYFREYEKMNEILSKWTVPPADENFEDKVISAITDKETRKSKSFLFSFIRPAFAGFTALALIIILALAYYLSLPVLVGQGKEIGDKLVSEEGPVFAVKTGEEIYAGSSDLELLLSDGSRIKLTKGSRLVIDAYRRNEKRCSLSGEMKAEIRKYPGQKFTIKTESGEVRVLGTCFIVLAMKYRTIISVIEGNVEVKGRTEKTQLTRGNMTVVSGASRFVTPVSILDAVKDKDKHVRIQALQALIGIRGKEEKQAITGLLNDADETVKAEAAINLGRPGMGNKEVIKLLLKALRDKDKFVRMYAAISLGKLKALEARDPLKWMAGDTEVEARIGGALGLAGLGEKAYDVAGMAKDLESGDAGIRCNAVKLFGKIGTEKAALKAVERLKDPEKKVRWYAVCALERLNNPKTFPALLEAVKDSDEDIKRRAIQAVSNVFYAEGAGEVALVLSETSSKEVKFTAIRALGYLLMNYYKNDKIKLAEILEKNINGRDRLLKVAALTAYARAMGTDSAQKVYEVSVKDGNKIMKEVSADILKIIKKQDFRFNLRPIEIRALGKLKEKAAVPVLLTAAGDWNPLTREAAMEGFENLGDKLYLPLLYEGMKDADSGVAEAAEEAVKTITN
ncbi:MAG: HEAT repeat domain-containing protein [Candidatus Firestonebacteria bacterium]